MMVDRLTTQDVSFLNREGPVTPMHVGSLAIFDRPEGGLEFDRIVELTQRRVALVPRYRQKVRWVPGNIANPIWIDDTEFDIGYHVRRSALPRPGTDRQLHELVARLQSRPLDRNRPLWEINIVEGLADGRFALVTKSHQSMVDGMTAVDIGQVILEPSPDPDDAPVEPWHARREPSTAQLIVDAVGDVVHRPTSLSDTVRMGVNDVRANSGQLLSTVGDLMSAARAAVKAVPPTPLNIQIGSQRRFAVARTELADYRQVRSYANATVNDVVLATVTGALRGWLLTRSRPVTPSTTVRAMVPLSVRTVESGVALGSRVSSYFVDLPVGEPNPLLRLTQISYAMTAHKESGLSVGADSLIALSGFAAPTLHALGARAASGITRRMFNLVVTNVPGPQSPLYLAGAHLREMFPIIPLAAGQALTIGLTSYDGGVYFGLNADWDAMSDVETLASLIEESLDELVAATQSAPSRSPFAAGRDPRRRAAPGKAASGKAASGKAASGKAASGKAASGKAASGKAASGKAAPRKAAPHPTRRRPT